MIFDVDEWSKCRNWNMFFGKDALVAASNNCSAHKGVWDECFRMTVFPDNKLGTIEFTDVLKG